MKKVRETKADKAIKAFVILNHEGVDIARVHIHYSDSGRVTVNVFNHYPSASQEEYPVQEAYADGYGYDKETAALAGMVIDGHILADHCGVKLESGGYQTAGLDYLRELGYKVYPAI